VCDILKNKPFAAAVVSPYRARAALSLFQVAVYLRLYSMQKDCFYGLMDAVQQHIGFEMFRFSWTIRETKRTHLEQLKLMLNRNGHIEHMYSEAFKALFHFFAMVSNTTKLEAQYVERLKCSFPDIEGCDLRDFVTFLSKSATVGSMQNYSWLTKEKQDLMHSSDANWTEFIMS
jgi:hypothetical protein